ncbi:MAG: cupin domain-containing protein [Thermomicrobiales bacterium]
MATRDEIGDGAKEAVFSRTVIEPATDELAFQPVWARKDDLAKFSPVAGLFMQAMTGGRMIVNWVTIEPNQVVPRHQHPHEQAGVMLEGMLDLTIGDETRTLRPGDAYAIPPHLPHNAATGAEGCVVLDVFSPPREDYVAMIGSEE